MKSITIIGGGASGTLLTINLLRSTHTEPLTINLVERREKVGVGVAFSTDKDTHLLNVPAGKMGAFPDEIDHFHRWLKWNGYDYSADDFVPRKIFGQYLRSLLQAATESSTDPARLRLINDEAVDVQVKGKPRVFLQSGEALDTALEVATRHVDSTGKVPLLPLVGLADVDPERARERLRAGGVEFRDLGLGLREQIAIRAHPQT